MRVFRLERVIPHRGLREWVEALLIALIVATLFRTFLFAPFEIPSGSMRPTLKVGDRLFASRFAYGIPVPFAHTRLFEQGIERKDIVIFPYPRNPSTDFIKRVIAVGGETVEVRGKAVYVDGTRLDEPYAYYDPRIERELKRTGRGMPDYGPVTVPHGKLFVMGDNRLNSADSRVWGFVDADTVEAKGTVIYWSHDPRRGWLSGYHLGRVGTILQ